MFGNLERQLAFMHSLRALSASALLMPLVFSLHNAIMLLGFSGLAERQVAAEDGIPGIREFVGKGPEKGGPGRCRRLRE